MKKSLFTITCFLLGLLSFTTQAQVISVTPGTDFNIVAATVISADSMDLVPAANFTINGSSLVKNNVVNNSTGITHLNRVYQFSTATNAFSGALKMYYNNAEVNGLTESSLKLLFHNGSSWSLDNNSSVNTTDKFVQNNSVSGVSLREITAGACWPNTGDTSASACISFVWYGNTYTSSATPTHTFTNVSGCDSVVTLHLTITPQPAMPTLACYETASFNTSSCSWVVTGTQPAAIVTTTSSCNTYTWLANGSNYTQSGTYSYNANCQNYTLNLTINQPTTSTTNATASGSYNWNGNTYNSSGIYTYHTNNASGCDSAALLNLTINAVVINNIVNVCTYIGTNQTLTYTASVAGASIYAWTLPANTQLISGQGTRSIVIKVLNGFASQANKQIRVTPAGGSLQVIYLAAQVPVTPAPITASTANICGSIGTNVSVTFKIPKVVEAASGSSTASSYLWTAQNGTTSITHPNGTGENDTTVTITFASNFTSSNLSVQALNACGLSGTRSYFITRNNPSQPSLISGPTNTCEYIGDNGQAATYAVSASVSVDSYTWTVPQGAIGFTGQGTNTISFKYPAGYTGGSISVAATNNCGTSQSRSLTVSRLVPSTPGNIDVINTTTCPSREYTYSVSNLPSNATSMLWTVPASGTIISGQGTRSITMTYPATVIDGYVTVKAVSNCGTSSTKVVIIKLAPCPAIPAPQYTKGLMSTTTSAMEVKVFPNPTTSSFNLQITAGGSKSATQARILDLQGRMMKTIQINPNENISLGAELKPGVYMLEVLQGKEKKVVRMVKY